MSDNPQGPGWWLASDGKWYPPEPTATGGEPAIELPDAEPYDTRWQYRIIHIGAAFAPQRLGIALSYFGQRGWELAHVYDKSSNWISNIENGLMLFKKPVPPGDDPDGAWAEVWTISQVAHAYNEAKRQARQARRSARARQDP